MHHHIHLSAGTLLGGTPIWNGVSFLSTCAPHPLSTSFESGAAWQHRWFQLAWGSKQKQQQIIATLEVVPHCNLCGSLGEILARPDSPTQMWQPGCGPRPYQQILQRILTSSTYYAPNSSLKHISTSPCMQSTYQDQTTHSLPIYLETIYPPMCREAPTSQTRHPVPSQAPRGTCSSSVSHTPKPSHNLLYGRAIITNASTRISTSNWSAFTYG